MKTYKSFNLFLLMVFISAALILPMFSYGQDTVPLLTIYKILDPDTIWKKGLGMTPEVATCTLRAVGSGDTLINALPIDVVFACDLSGSMNSRLSGSWRLTWAQRSANYFIDSLRPVYDRVAILGWSADHDSCRLSDTSTSEYMMRWFNFSNDMAAAKNFVTDSLYIDNYNPSTEFGPTINYPGGSYAETPRNVSTVVALRYLEAYATAPSRALILLTDGNNDDRVRHPFILNFADSIYRNFDIRTYMIAFGAPSNLITEITEIATAGGGKAYSSNDPAELDSIFLNISKELSATVAIKVDTGSAMIIDVLPPHLHFIDNGNCSLGTGNNSAVIDSFKIDSSQSYTLLSWYVSKIEIDDIFEVSYDFTSTWIGYGPINQTRDDDAVNYSRVYYRDYDDSVRVQEFTRDSIYVKNYTVSGFEIAARQNAQASFKTDTVFIKKNAINGRGEVQSWIPASVSVKPLNLYFNANTTDGWKDTTAQYWTFLNVDNQNRFALGLPDTIRDTSHITIPLGNSGLVPGYVIIEAGINNGSDKDWFTIWIRDTNTYFTLDTVAIFTAPDTLAPAEYDYISLFAGQSVNLYAIAFDWDEINKKFGKFIDYPISTWTIDTSGISRNDTVFIEGDTLKILQWNQLSASRRDSLLTVAFKRAETYKIALRWDTIASPDPFVDTITLSILPDTANIIINLEQTKENLNPKTSFPDISYTIADGIYNPDITLYLVKRDIYGNYMDPEKITSITYRNNSILSVSINPADSTSLVFSRRSYAYINNGIFRDTVEVTGVSGKKDLFYINTECFMDGASIYEQSSPLNLPADSISLQTGYSLSIYCRGYFLDSSGAYIGYGPVNASWKIENWPDSSFNINFTDSMITLPPSSNTGTAMVSFLYNDILKGASYTDTIFIIIEPGNVQTISLETGPVNTSRIDISTILNSINIDTKTFGLFEMHLVSRDNFGNFISKDRIDTFDLVSNPTGKNSLVRVLTGYGDASRITFQRVGSDPLGVSYDLKVRNNARCAGSWCDNIQITLANYEYGGLIIGDSSRSPYDSSLSITTDSSIKIFGWAIYDNPATPQSDTIYDAAVVEFIVTSGSDTDTIVSHSYEIKPFGPGQIKITAKYETFTDSLFIMITPGRASRIEISRIDVSGKPAADDDVKAGVPFYIKVTAKDKYGNLTSNWNPDSILLHNDIPALNGLGNTAWHYGADSASTKKSFATWPPTRFSSTPSNGTDMFAITLAGPGYHTITLTDSLFAPVKNATIVIRVITPIDSAFIARIDNGDTVYDISDTIIVNDYGSVTLAGVSRTVIGSDTIYNPYIMDWSFSDSTKFPSKKDSVYEIVPVDTGVFAAIITVPNPEGGNFIDTVWIKYTPGPAKYINLVIVDSSGAPLKDNTVRAGRPFFVKIEALDAYGYPTSLETMDSVLIKNDLLPSNSNKWFDKLNLAYNNPALPYTNSIALDTGYTNWLPLQSQSSGDIFQIILVNSFRSSQTISIFDSLFTKDSASLSIYVKPGPYWKTILVDFDYSLEEYWVPLGKDRYLVDKVDTGVIDTILLSLDGTASKYIGALPFDSAGNFLAGYGGIPSLWSSTDPSIASSLVKDAIGAQNLNAGLRLSAKGYVRFFCAFFDTSSNNSSNWDSVYVIIDNPTFLDSLYTNDDSLYEGDSVTSGGDGYLDGMELFFRYAFKFKFSRQRMIKEDIIVPVSTALGIEWFVDDIKTKDSLGAWTTIWHDSLDSLPAISSSHYYLVLNQNSGPKLETGFLPDSVYFDSGMQNDTVFSSLRIKTHSRIKYVDKAGPVIDSAFWTNNACDSKEMHHSLMITFSEDVGADIENNNKAEKIDSLFKLILPDRSNILFKNRSLDQYVKTSSNSIKILQKNSARVPLINKNNTKITLSELTAVNRLVWDHNELGTDSLRQNLPHSNTRKVIIKKTHDNSLICNASIGSNPGGDKYIYYPGAIGPASDPANKSAHQTTIFVTITDSARITVNIFDLLGNMVRTITNEQGETVDFREAGTYEVKTKWDHRNEKGRWVARGGYIIIIKAYFIKRNKIEIWPPIPYCYR
ncbi:MAG: hypothetical protein ABIA63_07240 [bacterium]